VNQHVIKRWIIYHLHTQAQAHGTGHNVQPAAVAGHTHTHSTPVTVLLSEGIALCKSLTLTV